MDSHNTRKPDRHYRNNHCNEQTIRQFQPNDLITNKSKAFCTEEKQIKYDSQCPSYGWELTCTNEVINSYCSFYHNYLVRKAHKLYELCFK